jgi:hypothetical protein
MNREIDLSDFNIKGQIDCVMDLESTVIIY